MRLYAGRGSTGECQNKASVLCTQFDAAVLAPACSLYSGITTLRNVVGDWTATVECLVVRHEIYIAQVFFGSPGGADSHQRLKLEMVC